MIWLSLVMATATVLYVRGFRAYAIQTASMSPRLKRGDIVIVKALPVMQVKVGEVITYRSLSNQRVTVTHRLIAVDYGHHKLLTKGDRLEQADPQVPFGNVIGRVKWFVPKLGLAISTNGRPLGLLLMLNIIPATVLSVEVANFVRQRSHSYRL